MGVLTDFDFSLLFNMTNLFAIVFGTAYGMLIGALPGLGASVGVTMLFPLIYQMDAIPALIMMMSLYQGASYGGSISAVTLGIPGQAGAISTVLDGNAMARNGEPGRALGISLFASTVGGILGVLVLMFATGPLAGLATKLTDPELFLVATFGMLTLMATGDNFLKTGIMLLLGLMTATVGLDIFSGNPRFTMGSIILYDGFKLVPIITGMFAIAEIFNMSMGNTSASYVADAKKCNCRFEKKDVKMCLPTVIKSGIIGVVCGIIPGLGCESGSFLAYTEAKRVAKNPDEFGEGSPLGIAAPESGNNGAVAGALVPWLAIGLPGSGFVAVISGVLVVKGITPGPTLMSTNTDFVYTLMWGLLLATIFMFVLGFFATSIFARLLVIPNYILAPLILMCALIGAYCCRNQFFDIWVAIVCGVIGFFAKKLHYPVGAFALALVLAGLFEMDFRRSLLISQGNLSIFVSRPVCIVLWILIAFVLFSVVKKKKKPKKERR
ncbi:tripartite tricarboxylate transporter permease [Hominifimenecus sp. rT4P-3]|uniref:tripartite tricarboxylate transporter permease n=1 Tax=Hominifimenecus sp. rT4P-3 TaxID=3242979 RepID=UPI003DA45D92